jgi:penicillin-binding protein 1A
MTYRQRQQRRRRRRGKNPVLITLAVFGIIGATAIASAVGYVISVASSAPDISELKPISKGASSEVFAADGSRLGYVQADEIRTPVRYTQIPPPLRQATVAIEDERFYHHHGVDYSAIIRAAFKNIESGGTVQGGSTITQQLVRALYIKDPKRNLERKIREAKLASELEKKHSKQWILTSYLNDVPYGTIDGRTAIGVEAASETFFNKHAWQLDLPQMALLAGLPQAPSEFNPFRNPTAALDRRNEVLQAMTKQHMITQPQADSAASAGLRLHKGTRYTKRREPYFFDFVQEQLIERYGVGVYRRGGLKIYTTVDPNLQKAGRDAINGVLSYSGDPSGAVVAIDPSNGYIKAMASSGTYNDRTFNLAAQGHRQPGSAFKPFVLTTAIRQGINPATTSYTSKPLSLNIPGYGPWNVKTYGNTYIGTANLVEATLKSDNTIYAQLDVDVGPKEVAKTAKEMGITTKLDGIPSEGLGGLRLGVSPLEMADAYATLAAGGKRHRPIAIKRVVFPDGKSDNLGEPKSKRIFSDGVAWEVTKILQMNIQRGTGTGANIGCPAAGKTGTTDNFNDAWFVGYTPKLTAAVWVGYPNALTEMRGVHGINVAGGTLPADIWHAFMSVAHGSDCSSFSPPQHPATFGSFSGAHSAGGSSGGAYQSAPPGGGGGNSAGGQNYRGYDPRLYESPPQGAPQTQSPPSTPQTPDTGGGGTGGGGTGGGGGNNGGGTGGGTGQ